MIKHTIKSKEGLVEVNLTRAKAIRYFCYECMGWQKQYVRGCTALTCPLYPFRPGQKRKIVSKDIKTI